MKPNQTYLKFSFHRSSGRRSRCRAKIGGPTTDGTFRQAVFQPAGFCIPLFRPHRHPWISERAVASRTSGLLFRNVAGVPVVDKAALSKRTGEYRGWVEAFARNHKIPMEWAQKGVRKEDYVRPGLRRMERAGQYGVYFIFQSMEQGPTFRCSMPKFPTQDPNHRILRAQRSRFTHYYFYLRDETLGPMVMRVASFFPFQATYYLNGHSF